MPANLLDLLFFETTSTYFERDSEDDPDDQDVRFIICHNPDQAERDAQQREDAIARIEAELVRISEQRARDTARHTGDKTRIKNEAAHVRAECALRDPPLSGGG